MKPFDEHFFGMAAGFALLASTAVATGVGSYSSIERLPDEGKVTLSGTVSEVDDKDSFILKDSAGKTIDVHTAKEVALDIGDKVTVSGEMQDEALGMGQEIASATISVESHMKAPSSPASKSSTSTPDDENRTKLNNESNAVPGYDVDVDVKKTQDRDASDY